VNRPIIIGAGIAGMTVALELAPQPVTLISPYPLAQECSSAWAQGGIAAAVDDHDAPDLHTADTLAAGAGLNDEAAVRQTVGDGKTVIETLARAGVPFDRDSAGRLTLGLEAAHSRRRIVHAADSTGLAVMVALTAKVRASEHITLIENARVTEILTDDNKVIGVMIERDGETSLLPATQIILASGGAAGLWAETTNPHGNWGSGLALAARAGAVLSDLEFVQFHPTAIDVGLDPMPLASEAVRGEGIKLILETGERFTDELQARDIVARAIYAQIASGHRVFLDTPQMGAAFAARFPTITEKCRAAGIDPVTAPIPVKPAAHYHMGGVATDLNGATSVEGLWACGEVASTGLHGANRLASNSLLEAVSFGQRAAAHLRTAPQRPLPTLAARLDRPRQQQAQTIRAMMSRTVGVTRDADGLRAAIDALRPLAQHSDMALVGLMIAVSAERRRESRGSHYRTDFPQTQPHGERSRLRLSDLKDLL
jgi:L-aspartate oxidase